MLTVKYVKPNGSELVFPALDVTYDKRGGYVPTPLSHEPTHGHVIFNRPKGADDQIEHAYDGRIYVMSEAGKTVATYDLGGWPEQDVPTESRKPSTSAAPRG